MSRAWIAALLFLSACSSLNFQMMRAPAAIGSCNRQALGVTSAENSALILFNNKRRDVVVQLLQSQMDRLQSKADTSTQQRLNSLRGHLKSISSDEMKAWAEPNEVSYKLRKALDQYVSDASVDEKNNNLDEKAQQKLKYVRETLQPNISELAFWIPEFCKSSGANSSPEIFKGL